MKITLKNKVWAINFIDGGYRLVSPLGNTYCYATLSDAKYAALQDMKDFFMLDRVQIDKLESQLIG